MTKHPKQFWIVWTNDVLYTGEYQVCAPPIKQLGAHVRSHRFISYLDTKLVTLLKYTVHSTQDTTKNRIRHVGYHKRYGKFYF